jgi:hypothetical protein
MSEIMDLQNGTIFPLIDPNGPSWGDIALDTPVPSRNTTPAASPIMTPRPQQDETASFIRITPENEDSFFGYETPDLVMRKDIWENFPVTLIPLGKDESGAERHSVQWHRKNLLAGRDETDFNEYVERTERRVLKALNASSKWDVLDSETEEWFVPGKDLEELRKEICIIRMVFLPSSSPSAEAEVAEEPKVAMATEAVACPLDEPAKAGSSAGVEYPSRGPKPMLKKLNDIKIYFPVVWHTQPAEGGHPIYALEIHGKQAKDRGLEAGAMATLKADLMAALRQSTAWRVLAPQKPKEVCRLELAFDVRSAKPSGGEADRPGKPSE